MRDTLRQFGAAYDAFVRRLLGRRQSKSFAQVNHRDDIAAQVEHSLDEGGHLRHPGDGDDIENLAHLDDIDGKALRRQLEGEKLLVVHGCCLHGHRDHSW